MFLRTITFVAALLFPLSGAMAQGTANGLYYHGFLQAEVVAGNTNAQGIYGDMTIGYVFNGQSSFPIGVEISGIAAEYSGTTSTSEMFGVVFAETGFGRFSLGVPRPVSDSLLPEVVFSSVGALANQYTFFSRSPVHFIGLTQNEIAGGFGYSRTLGQTEIGASLHRYSVQQINILDLAARRQYGNIAVSAALQVTFLPGGLGQRKTSQFGVDADFGRSKLAFLYSDANWFAGASVYSATYKYAVTDRTGLTASISHISTTTSPVVGISGKHHLSTNAYLQAGVYGSTASGSSPIYSFSFGTKH